MSVIVYSGPGVNKAGAQAICEVACERLLAVKEVRTREEWDASLEGKGKGVCLIVPGGSTAQLFHGLNPDSSWQSLESFLDRGGGILGICAGANLLSREFLMLDQSMPCAISLDKLKPLDIHAHSLGHALNSPYRAVYPALPKAESQGSVVDVRWGNPLEFHSRSTQAGCFVKSYDLSLFFREGSALCLDKECPQNNCNSLVVSRTHQRDERTPLSFGAYWERPEGGRTFALTAHPEFDGGANEPEEHRKDRKRLFVDMIWWVAGSFSY